MGDLIGVIPAAGQGVRARPDSLAIPKPLFAINGTSILQRTIEIMRDQMGIRQIIIIVNEQGNQIEETFGNGARLGVRLQYVRNRNLDRGMAWSIYLSKEYVSGSCCVILGDECYIDANHRELARMEYRQALATCAIKKNAKPEQIKENYTVQLDENGRISRLIEKPTSPDNGLLGCGTFILSADIFPLLEAEYEQNGYQADFISFLDSLCRQGRPILPFWLTGGYVNVNDRDRLKLANTLNKTISEKS